ncbi:MAG: hypothetical protein IRZ26_05930 [Clostridia bacterium]|nr:hypothetical protein [Clostridia bacterium]MCL6521566.1 hypothetical protein [Bacillota bacterium]
MVERPSRRGARLLPGLGLALLLVLAAGCGAPAPRAPLAAEGGEALLLDRSLQLYGQLVGEGAPALQGLLRPDSELVEETELLSLGEHPAAAAVARLRAWLQRHPRSGAARLLVPFDPSTPGSLAVVELPLRGGFLYLAWDSAGRLAKLYASSAALDWRAMGQEGPEASSLRVGRR